MQTMCDRQKGYFQFVIKGQTSDISGGIKIIFPLKSPETCKAVECIVDTEKIFCIMDAYKYDLSGEKRVEVYEDEPKIDNFKFTNWKEYFKVENRIINEATNCKPDGKKPGRPDDDEDNEKQIFAMFKITNIQIIGCFRNKKNIKFQLTKIKDDKSIVKDTLEKDIYFKIPFKKPKNETAFCVIPQNNIDITRCAIGNGGEIEIGEEVNSTVNIKGKEYIIIFKSSSINVIKVDECFEKQILLLLRLKILKF